MEIFLNLNNYVQLAWVIMLSKDIPNHSPHVVSCNSFFIDFFTNNETKPIVF